MITLAQFRRIEAAVRAAGYSDAIAWSENIVPPDNADAFAEHAIYVICNSGMKNSVAMPIHERCMAALRAGGSATDVFGHPGKAAAIDRIWRERDTLFAAFRATDDVLAFCATLPWIGPVTKYHLAKNLGGDLAKPDVHLNRLARRRLHRAGAVRAPRHRNRLPRRHRRHHPLARLRAGHHRLGLFQRVT